MRDIARQLISRWVPDAQTRLGRVIRWPLRAIPSGLTVPILTGPNRGFRWIVGASVHGCWIGNYESSVADRLWSRLSSGDVFYDIGANVGYYTLLGSRAVGPNGRVVAFEPLPRNIQFLRQHLALNEIVNVDLVESAVVERDGPVRFMSQGSPSQAQVSGAGTVTVSGRSLESLRLRPPDLLKMDVEGAEVQVLRGGRETLRRHRPLIIFSTHGEELRRECYDLLRRLGYEVAPLNNQIDHHIAEPDS